MTYSISVEPRVAGKADVDRNAGLVPGVIYGGDRDQSTSVAVRFHDLETLYETAGESSLIDLSLPGQTPVKVLIHAVQYDPVSGRITHVDFRQIKMNEEMTATVELSYIGEAPSVKGLGGTLVRPHMRVSVRCLPKDLVSSIDVDLTKLVTFDDVIHVSDLSVPSGITITDNVDLVVAKVMPPLTEEQLKAMEETAAPVDLSKIEVEKKGKKEEAGAEGEDDEKTKEVEDEKK